MAAGGALVAYHRGELRKKLADLVPREANVSTRLVTTRLPLDRTAAVSHGEREAKGGRERATWQKLIIT